MIYKKLVLIFAMLFASSSYTGTERVFDNFVQGFAISAGIHTAAHGVAYLVEKHPKALIAGTVAVIAVWYYTTTQKEKRNKCNAQIVY